MTKPVLNQRGQSIIQAMVAVAIMGIGMMAMLTMQASQNKENKALGEKLAALDFERVLTANLANASTCNGILAPSNLSFSSALTFDATHVSALSPLNISLKEIAGVKVGGQVSPNSSMVLISNIELSVTSAKTANVLIKFEQEKLVRSIRNLSFPVILQTVGPLTATTITGCGGAGIPSGVPVGGCEIVVNFGGSILATRNCWGGISNNSAGTNFSCPNGTKLISIGMSDDSMGKGEKAPNGVDLWAKCSGPSHTCHVTTFMCIQQ